MDKGNNGIKAARNICRSVPLLIKPPFHLPVTPLARFASLPTVPPFHHSITPIFPLEKYSLSRQWSSLFPTLYFLFPFLADHSSPFPLPASPPSPVIVRNIPGLSRQELKRQIIYKEPRYEFFFDLHFHPAVNKQRDTDTLTPRHTYKHTDAHIHRHTHKHTDADADAHTHVHRHTYKHKNTYMYMHNMHNRWQAQRYAGISPAALKSYLYSYSFYGPHFQPVFPSISFPSRSGPPVSQYISGSIFTPSYASSAIVFEHLRHIGSIPMPTPIKEAGEYSRDNGHPHPPGVPALEFIRGEASPLRPRPHARTQAPFTPFSRSSPHKRTPGRSPMEKSTTTPLSLIFPALFFPTDIHLRGDTRMDKDTYKYTYNAVSQGLHPGPQTPSVFPGKQPYLRSPSLTAAAMFAHAYPAAAPPASLTDSRRWNWPRLKFPADRPLHPRQHYDHQERHHRYREQRQVFTFTHPAELFHKLLPLSLPLPAHGNRDQKVFSISGETQHPRVQSKAALSESASTYTHPGHHLTKIPAAAAAPGVMSPGMPIPVSVTGTSGPGPPGPFSSLPVSSFSSSSSFLALFHYNRDTGAIHEKTRLSIGISRKIAAQVIGIKDPASGNRFFSSPEPKQEMKHLREFREGEKNGEIVGEEGVKQPLSQLPASSRRLPLQYLNPWKIASEALGIPDAHGDRHYGSRSSAGTPANSYRYQDGKGHKRGPYEPYGMQDEPYGPHGHSHGPPVSSKKDIDLDQLTQRVYTMLERRIRLERERRGR